MKLTKEEIYISLQGKTKEELTDLWEFLKEKNEPTYNKSLQNFIKDFYNTDCDNNGLEFHRGHWLGSDNDEHKTEITIKQLKEILQHMETFTPIAMKCNQEQFDAVKPKLKDKEIYSVTSFNSYPYLINTDSGDRRISNTNDIWLKNRDYKVHEAWNEEIFLKACGIEVETLQEKVIRLENELNEVKQQIKEENKPKVGDWIINTQTVTIFKNNTVDLGINDKWNKYKKITNQELLKLLEQEIK